MRRIILTFALIIGILHTSLQADDYLKNLNIDILNYVFRLVLSDDTDVINGETTVDIRFLTDGVEEFSLDLIGTSAGSTTGMTVTGVTEGSNSLRFVHENNKVKIYLSSPSKINQRSQFTVSYRGIPADGLIISTNKYEERTFFGDNWPNRARNWLPTIDHPYEKATNEFIITAPEHYQVIANGLKIEETNYAGSRTTHWKQSVPISSYLMVIGVARFAVQYVDYYEGKSVQTWVYPQDRDNGFYDFARAKRVLEFFGSRVGPYPYEKLANVQSKTRYGGMENASAIFYSERSVSGQRRSEGTVTHEIAHQWFGDSVTADDWHHIWLSEGFATYFTHLFNEFTYGRDRMVEGLLGNQQRIINYYRQNPTSPVVDERITVLTDLLNANSYQKGGWVLHMLRGVIGDEDFWGGIRQYYKEYRDDNALTEDLQRVMEEVSGRELSWFFQQWIYQPGQPKYEGTWSYDSVSKELNIEVNQVQTDGTLFRMPVEFGINFDGNTRPRIEKFQIDKIQNSFTISLEIEPASVVLDPNTWILKEAEFTKK